MHLLKCLLQKRSIQIVGYSITPAGAVDCFSLTNINNGVVTYSTTTSGSTATYACESGYDLIGNQIRVCQDDGQWSGSEPTCERKLHQAFSNIIAN